MNPNDQKRIILAGGTGFLGSILAEHFGAAGWDVLVLSRAHPHPNEAPNHTKRQISWDGKTLGPWTAELEHCAALVNLSGRNINCRFTARNKKEILDSRVDSTKVLGAALARCQKPPAVWLNCSGAAIYNESFGRNADEDDTNFSEAENGKNFLSQVALLWERALNEVPTPLTRKVALRISMVLGTGKGTTFPTLRKLAKAGLAGTMGSGKQYVSWIHENDFCRIVEWLIQKPGLHGPVNVTAPNPIPNAEFMRTLRHACGRSFGLPAAAWMLEIGAFFMRTETELILNSRRVVPKRLESSAFTFQFPNLAPALEDLEAKYRQND